MKKYLFILLLFLPACDYISGTHTVDIGSSRFFKDTQILVFDDGDIVFYDHSKCLDNDIAELDDGSIRYFLSKGERDFNIEKLHDSGDIHSIGTWENIGLMVVNPKRYSYKFKHHGKIIECSCFTISNCGYKLKLESGQVLDCITDIISNGK